MTDEKKPRRFETPRGLSHIISNLFGLLFAGSGLHPEPFSSNWQPDAFTEYSGSGYKPEPAKGRWDSLRLAAGSFET